MGKPSACCSIMCWVSLLAMSMVLHRNQGTQSSDVITLLLRACFENMVIRTILPGADRSIVGFGPACSFIALHDCDLGGVSGLLVPRTKVSASYQSYPRRDSFVPYQYHMCVFAYMKGKLSAGRAICMLACSRSGLLVCECGILMGREESEHLSVSLCSQRTPR